MPTQRLPRKASHGMKIDPKKIARMITEDPDEVVPSDHFDDFEDEYGIDVTYYIVEVPTEYHYRWADNATQGEYPSVAAEYTGEDINGPMHEIYDLKKRIGTLERSLQAERTRHTK